MKEYKILPIDKPNLWYQVHKVRLKKMKKIKK